MRDHFQFVVKEYGSIPNIGERRFEKLRSAFDPTIEELNQLADILAQASQRYKKMI